MSESPTFDPPNPASAHARLDPLFPVSLARLRDIYSQANFKFEFHRLSFSDVLSGSPDEDAPGAVEQDLTELSTATPRPTADLLQRHFYWSAACFYRSFYLMLAYFSLERKPMPSWAHVTAYYSRFYAIKALLNLFCANIVTLESKAKGDKKRTEVLIYLTMDGVKAMSAKKAKALWKTWGSHQVWWALFKQMQYVSDFPDKDGSHFALSDAYFNHASRNTINYSERYLEGFSELEWFDNSEVQMFSHMDIWRPRPDRDITNIDSFFADTNPEDADEGDFYGDDAQIVWHGVRVYLELLSLLKVRQSFVTREKLFGLLDRFGEQEYPILCGGIREAVTEYLPTWPEPGEPT
ncbi:MAG TPA: hypothetical protein VGP07_05975 [Polyangia bacterium]|jgi:hypothetical protein